MNTQIALMSDVEWGALNPARGDKGPRAANLWGDRTGRGPSGFLVKFIDGFSSPPHIHNITYRGVVIHGLVHNDDPDAAKMWMPPGSFWTQPAGEGHITAASGKTNMAYIEIDDGPYLVLPTEAAFDRGERPINADRSNIVWLDASELSWIAQSPSMASEEVPQVAFLWGQPKGQEVHGTFIKLPPGFAGTIRTHGRSFRAIVIEGQPTHASLALEPGSYFGAEGPSVHHISNGDSGTCIMYVRCEGEYEIIARQ